MFGLDSSAEVARLRRELGELREQLAVAEQRAARAESEVAKLREENHALREEKQALRDELAQLKGQKGKPKVPPSGLPRDPKRKGGRRGSHRKRGSEPPVPTRTEILPAADVPVGSRFKGYANYRVQELVLRSELVRYRIAKWLTPEGRLITGQLPAGLQGGHFGPTLRRFVLYQYYHAHVTEPLLSEELHEWGVVISSGQLHRMITEGQDQFHQEKDEILRVGLRVSGHIHTDDTGARHQGKNGYCTHIGNDWFAWFQSTESKSRLNFLNLLRAGATDYVLRAEVWDYLATQKLPKAILNLLMASGVQTFADATAWSEALEKWGIQRPHHVQIVTEGALLGAALEHGLNPKLAVMSDDAGQFNVLCHLLCWIHAERVLAKLVGFNPEQRAALDQVRAQVWELYRDLKIYSAAPTSVPKDALESRFDALCATKTCFTSLNLALVRMSKNKSELLRVLERPGLPLHNNLSEGDIREYVKRRKVSGGTRSEAGRRGRDTFASLKKTCRKLGVSFWNYLGDRLLGGNLIPPLPQLIEARAQSS